jgi:hypothetical protein
MFSRVAGREREGGGVRYQHLEEIVLLGARERDRLSRELADMRERVRVLEAQLGERGNEYRRGYQAGWQAGYRGSDLKVAA